MHDRADLRRRIDRVAARVDRRDGYGRLLVRGDVIRRIEEVEDVDAWRQLFKRQARANRINVRTGANEHIAFAYFAGGLTAARRG